MRSHVAYKRAATALSTLLLLGLTTAAFAAGGEGHHPDSGVLLKDFLYRTLNFAVTIGLLAYFVTKPIRRGLAGRREGIEKGLLQAQGLREEAEARFADYDNKLKRAEEEIEAIYAEIRREGELEREKILANAREMAEKIQQEAERTAAGEIARAKAELRQEATRMAVAIAEDLLKRNITTADQARLANEYMQKVGDLH